MDNFNHAVRRVMKRIDALSTRQWLGKEVVHPSLHGMMISNLIICLMNLEYIFDFYSKFQHVWFLHIIRFHYVYYTIDSNMVPPTLWSTDDKWLIFLTCLFIGENIRSWYFWGPGMPLLGFLLSPAPPQSPLTMTAAWWGKSESCCKHLGSKIARCFKRCFGFFCWNRLYATRESAKKILPGPGQWVLHTKKASMDILPSASGEDETDSSELSPYVGDW